MLEHWEDGRIKLFLMASGLRLRRQYPQAFLQGEYLALRASGEKADHVVAVLRRHEDQLILAVAPRLVASLQEGSLPALPIGENIWKDTRLDFHSSIGVNSFHNVLTDEQVPVRHEPGQSSLNIAEALSICPVALLQANSSKR